MQRFAKFLLIFSFVLPLLAISSKAFGDTVYTPASLYYTSLNTVAGNPQGNVTIVEFFDYNCEYCHRMPGILNQVIRSNPNVRLVYRDYPVLGPSSTYAARAALAASMQGRYMPFHNALFANRGLNEGTISSIASQVGVNMSEFNRDIMSGAVSQQIASTNSAARELNLSGVPVVVVAATPRKGEGSVPAVVMVSPSVSDLESAISQVSRG